VQAGYEDEDGDGDEVEVEDKKKLADELEGNVKS
jgi:hypothetical protein